MYRMLFLSMCVALVGCAAAMRQKIDVLDVGSNMVLMQPSESSVQMTESGSTFLAKFSTTNALNSTRSFQADYYGEVRVILYPNRIVECHVWTEGRLQNPGAREGRSLTAFSTLCQGKLQRDGSFAFQGAYRSKYPTRVSEEDAIAENVDTTFTITGVLESDTLIGELILSEDYRASIAIDDPDQFLDDRRGIVFEATEIEQ